MAGPAILRSSFLAGVLFTALAAAGLRVPQNAGAAERALRGTRHWPTREEWRALDRTVGGRLIRPVSPWARLSPKAPVPKRLRNPFYLEEHAGATQSTGMHRAWKSVPSDYAVACESVDDIKAAVDFARTHGVRIAVKGTGHDYFGRSCAPDSLLIWTHPMREITVHQAFVPAGAPRGTTPVHAVTTSAGNRWLEAYRAATAAGRYIQGGGCTSVGACGGFALGGGFGSYSKRFGSGAAGVLEIEVVTADGRIRTVNRFQEPDLFWALKGGGGGTFGVVSRMTLLSHPIPRTDGWLSGQITAHSDAAYQELIQRYLEFVPAAINNPDWGEGVMWRKGVNEMELMTAFLDLTTAEAEAVWAPLLDPLRARPADFTVETSFTTQPFRDKWNPVGKSGAVMDDRPNAPDGYFWWRGNGGEVGAYCGGYAGRGIPLACLSGAKAERLAKAIFAATRTSLVLWQTNKALAGEHPEALRRDRQTSLNPAVFHNAAFVTVGDWVQYKYPGVQGHEPDAALAQAQMDGVNRALRLITAATSGGGSYTNEGDFFERAWKSEFWGSNYARLARIKSEYDPDNLFRVHHGVGSDMPSRLV
jgi:FAD/FMN-containing dehydrogenase